VQAWNSPASFTFTLDGHDESAAYVNELQHDVVAWRWDDTAGVDRPLFRGVVGQSQDQLTTEQHVVTFTCHDYLAVLGRRFNGAAYSVTQQDQDVIVAFLLALGSNQAHSTYANVSFMPGSYLPLTVQNVNPDGSARAANSGALRDRTYPPQTEILHALTDLAAVSGGFDLDVLPFGMGDNATDALRIFYPRQGVTRTAPVLLYGGAVATVTRAVNSADYANYARVLGNGIYGEAWNADATGVTVGLWSYPDSAADATVQGTVTDKANGDLAYYGVLLPSYTIGLTPNVFYAGMFNMGDTLPLVITSGRLQVNTPVRVTSITYDVNDDGDENIKLTVGRPTTALTDLLGRTASDVAALTRR
jgi:hypothetical protein